MEFKRELPAKGNGDPDPWMTGQKKIGRRAKAQILKEVVSFANAYGGVFVLGIEEDKNATPPVAKAICPIPNCEKLAERFRMIFRDRVEPKLPSCDIRAVVKGLRYTVVRRNSSAVSYSSTPAAMAAMRSGSDNSSSSGPEALDDVGTKPAQGQQPVDKIPPAFERRCIRAGRFASPVHDVKHTLHDVMFTIRLLLQGFALRCSSGE